MMIGEDKKIFGAKDKPLKHRSTENIKSRFKAALKKYFNNEKLTMSSFSDIARKVKEDAPTRDINEILKLFDCAEYFVFSKENSNILPGLKNWAKNTHSLSEEDFNNIVQAVGEVIEATYYCSKYRTQIL